MEGGMEWEEEWNGMEWEEEWNGMEREEEWNGRNGMGGGMERNRMKEEWNGMEWRRNGRSSVKLLHDMYM